MRRFTLRSTETVLVIALALLLNDARGLVAGNVCRVTLVKTGYVISVWSHPEELSERLGAPTERVGIAALEVWRTWKKQPELVWSIEALSTEMVRSVAYGEVPEGYHQIFPLKGRPEPLREGEEYRLTCGGEGWFKVMKDGVVNEPGGPDK
jgi:hypothetical protein